MRVRYSFSSRRTGHIENIRRQRQKYPEIAKKILESSDVILQVLDARYIQDTRNLELEAEIKESSKKIIFVLNKADLISKIKKRDLEGIYPYVAVSCKTRKGLRDLRDLIKRETKDIEKDSKKFDKITVGVIGYPNTGKSSLINVLIGKNSAKTGQEAGFTKGLQKLNLTAEVQLIDSPGVIPNEEYSGDKTEAISKHTIVGGRSFSQVKDPEMVIAEIMKRFPKVLEKHYKIRTAKADSEYLIEKLGRQKNYLKKANQVDVDKTSRFIIKEWQEGKIKV